MSNREQSGLRGRVKSCMEESIHPAVAYEGGSSPEIRHQSVTEYDSDGHTVSVRHGNSDGSTWVTRSSYDASGLLMQTASGNEGNELSETIYSYDQQGRLQTIVDGRKSDNPVSFRYDEQGKKIRIVTSRAADYRPNMATGLCEFEVLGAIVNLPGGGTATTFYDEQDRAVEIEVRNENGELVQRASRTFDDQGHAVQEKLTMEDAMPMFSPDILVKITKESGVSPEQVLQDLRAGLAKLLGGESSLYSVSYEYDSLGRVSRKRLRIFNREEEIETTYNEQGDVQSEIIYSEVRYSYQYDQYGNWTEKTTTYRSSPYAEFQASTVTKRTLSYY